MAQSSSPDCPCDGEDTDNLTGTADAATSSQPIETDKGQRYEQPEHPLPTCPSQFTDDRLEGLEPVACLPLVGVVGKSLARLETGKKESFVVSKPGKGHTLTTRPKVELPILQNFIKNDAGEIQYDANGNALEAAPPNAPFLVAVNYDGGWNRLRGQMGVTGKTVWNGQAWVFDPDTTIDKNPLEPLSNYQSRLEDPCAIQMVLYPDKELRLNPQGQTIQSTGYRIGYRRIGGVAAGTVMLWAGTQTPTGWTRCDGKLLTKATFQQLFNVFGYNYGGAGENFAVPNINPTDEGLAYMVYMGCHTGSPGQDQAYSVEGNDKITVSPATGQLVQNYLYDAEGLFTCNWKFYALKNLLAVDHETAKLILRSTFACSGGNGRLWVYVSDPGGQWSNDTDPTVIPLTGGWPAGYLAEVDTDIVFPSDGTYEIRVRLDAGAFYANASSFIFNVDVTLGTAPSS